MELVFRRFDIDNNNNKLINYESLISVLKDEHYDLKIIKDKIQKIMDSNQYSIDAVFRKFQNNDCNYILRKDFKNMISKLDLSYDD